MYIKIWGFCILLWGTCLSVSAQLDTAQYIREIEEKRKEKDKEFKKGDKSPLNDDDRKKFKTLSYFPVDPGYRVEARFTRTPDEKPFKMKTSRKWEPEFVKYGELTFELDSTEYKLNVYQNVKSAEQPNYDKSLFLPFKDETNSKETSEYGRYIDIYIPESDTIIVDFNLSHNCVCTYSARFACPLTPEENHLSVAIKAGEQDFRYGQ